jgi:hypothetical protein
VKTRNVAEAEVDLVAKKKQKQAIWRKVDSQNEQNNPQAIKLKPKTQEVFVCVCDVFPPKTKVSVFLRTLLRKDVYLKVW